MSSELGQTLNPVPTSEFTTTVSISKNKPYLSSKKKNMPDTMAIARGKLRSKENKLLTNYIMTTTNTFKQKTNKMPGTFPR